MANSSENSSSSSVSRRSFLAGAGACVAGVSASVPLSLAKANEEVGLAEMAAARGLDFGYAVQAEGLDNPIYQQALTRDCTMIVPEYQVQWPITEPAPFEFDYAPGDKIAAFAQSHGIGLRGHAAAWHGYMPDWAKDRISSTRDIDLLYRRVHEVVSHYRGQFREWDVVNEAIEPNDGLSGSLRNSLFHQAAGEAYLARCFHIAHTADPDAKLYYTDFDLTYAGGHQDRRRAGVLGLIRALKDRGVPIHGLGLQSHLKIGRHFDADVYARFLAAAAELEIEIKLTEVDLSDIDLRGSATERDEQAAIHAKEVLDVALANTAVKGVLCWGVRDADSWLNWYEPRHDGQSHSALPLNERFEKKPLWHAIGAALEAAPHR